MSSSRELNSRLTGWPVRKLLLFLTLLSVAAIGGCLLFEFEDRHSAIDFDRDIRPLFNEKCVVCHGGVHREAGLSLLSRSAALAPGESGKRAVVAGEAEESELIRRVTHPDPKKRMPAEGDPLSEGEIEKLKLWIEQGATWPRHWAYVRPEAPEPPAVSDPSWIQNEIDAFVLARLDKEGMKPNPPAECATLIRRVSLDLIGLPPTPRQVEDFCNDPSSEAYEKTVDRLLSSPHFGERWAAMWMDLGRYADSQGYEKDPNRSIWRYRDWVIRAFNQDMPFDRFTIEQLAADLLPDPSKDQLIATAFHRNTMTNTEGGTDDEEFRVAAVIDRVNTTMEIWQGTTMKCVQCHNHPFDPFEHEEFYQFYAFFNQTEDADYSDDRPRIPSFSDETREAGRRLWRQIEDLRTRIRTRAEKPRVTRKRQVWKERLRRALLKDPKLIEFEGEKIPRHVLQIAVKAPEERLLREERKLDRFYDSIAPALASLNKLLVEKRKALESLDPVWTPIMRELSSDERRRTFIFERGNWLTRGEEVQPGVPEVLNVWPEGAARNRLGVARWLVSPENPLTARVIVNRFWAQLFGRGIVETLGDFGTQGARPSHPELLDWLAVQFRTEHQWRLKSLLKQIVMSATYRQSSRMDNEKLTRDPRNRLLARGPRFRLSAEQIRDQALAVSGLLSQKIFGPSVMPPQPPGIWRQAYSKEQWQVSEGEDRYRRAVYIFWKRTSPYPSMITFDAPSRELCLSQRFRTNTPLQALVTLNDPVYVEAARALAHRMAYEKGPGIEDRIRWGYRLALGKRPDEEKLDALLDLYERSLEYYRKNPKNAQKVDSIGVFQPESLRVRERSASSDPGQVEVAALTVVANAIMNLDEFLTKE